MPKVHDKVRSIYGLTGEVVGICHPTKAIIILMEGKRVNIIGLEKFDWFYKILPSGLGEKTL